MTRGMFKAKAVF